MMRILQYTNQSSKKPQKIRWFSLLKHRLTWKQQLRISKYFQKTHLPLKLFHLKRQSLLHKNRTRKDQMKNYSNELLHSEALEILTNPTETEIPEKSAENLEMSKTPETNEAQEEQAVEAQRSSAEAEKETQMEELEASKSPVAIFEGQNEAEERDSLSRDISNFTLGEAEEESERTLKINDEEDVQDDAESLPMQLFQRTLSSHQARDRADGSQAQQTD
ncbi:unnamed protein product [Cuscuta campestris]|uniref:Uncharacterized protein n=1 Tax=Cuscuta campestris TaxID=132261 RepID=A0A484MS26_9ASTE|nr:unnamed protein product [Cuscuta campestris]